MSARVRYPAHHSRTMQRLTTSPTGVPIPEGVQVWGSRDHLAVLYHDPNGHDRLTINSTLMDRSTGRWDDGITWDELMAIKAQCGFADRWAVEVYPPDAEVVDVANLRHLWLLPAPPPYAWTTAQQEAQP